MRKNLILIFLIFLGSATFAQTTGSIVVGGDFDKFYPTLWTDGGWYNNVASQLEIGRSDIHQDSDWRGSVIAKFSFHTFVYGHRAKFIDADITQYRNSTNDINLDFIAGWRDATMANGGQTIIIWLRGGGTTYQYKSLFPSNPIVYDGVANPLPFQEVNGPAHTFKTKADAYVNSNGISKEGSAFFNGSTSNYFAGNLGIGIYDTKGYKLAVAGNMIAESIKVQLQGSWADYVFDEGYNLPKLNEIESFVKKNKHLPGIPSAAEVKSEGIDLGQMNEKLLKKIEEITLIMIQLNKKVELQSELLKQQQKELSSFKRRSTKSK